MTDTSIGEESPVVKKELPYDERPVLKLDALGLEHDEYLLKEVTTFPGVPSSPVGRALPLPEKSEAQKEAEIHMSVSDFYASENPLESPKAAETPPEIPDIEAFAASQQIEDEPMLDFIVSQNAGLEFKKEIELEVLPVSKEPAPEIDELTKKIQQAKLALPENILNKLEAEKEDYITAKFNPVDPKEKARLEHRLKIYTYPNSDDVKNKQDAESKRDKLREEFAREFEERTYLKHEEDKLLHAFAGLNFKEPKLGYWETPEKHFERRLHERQKLIETNRAEILMSALKEKIREELTASARLDLECEQNLQELIEKPLTQGFVLSSFKPSPKLIELAKKHKQEAKPVIDLLFRARKGLAEKQALYSTAENFCAYREKIGDAIKATKHEMAAEDKAKKGFKRLGLQPKRGL
jgi:hypothetical protein